VLLGAVCSSVHGGGGIGGCDVALIPIEYHDRKWEGGRARGRDRESGESEPLEAPLAQAMPGPRMQCPGICRLRHRDGPRHITISHKNEFYK
jgi:hypothetical protein